MLPYLFGVNALIPACRLHVLSKSSWLRWLAYAPTLFSVHDQKNARLPRTKALLQIETDTFSLALKPAENAICDEPVCLSASKVVCRDMLVPMHVKKKREMWPQTG